MEKKDILLKEYLGDNVHFCDFINGVLFKGKTVLEPEQVEDCIKETCFLRLFQWCFTMVPRYGQQQKRCQN